MRQRSHVESCPMVMCFRNHAVWHLKQADQRKGLHLTANYWSHFGSLCQLMRANISYILLYDLLVFKGAHSCAIHLVVNQNAQIHTSLFPSALIAEGEPGLRAATSKQHSWRQFIRRDLTSQDRVYHPAECLMSTVLIRGCTDAWNSGDEWFGDRLEVTPSQY